MRDLIKSADPKVLTMWENLTLGYTESQGHLLLREEIAGLYQSVQPREILTIVPQEGIFIAMNAILNKGDHIIVTTPTYQSLYEIANSLDCTVTQWPLAVNNGRWALDIDVLTNAITEKTKLVIVNFPNNPTGYLPSKTLFKELLTLVESKGIYLFSDEMYQLLEHDETNRLPSVADVYRKGISLFGFSKSFGLPGLRLGWLVTKDQKLMKAFEMVKDYTTICSSAPSEILGIMALKNKKSIVSRNQEIVKENLAISESFFKKHAHLFEWIEPDAGSIAFPRLKSSIPVMDFCEAIIKEKSIMIVPGNIFDFPGNHFRIGYGRNHLQVIYNELDDYINETARFSRTGP
jgi:aspartate/methionine/tyrosine aminotransferase